MRISLARMGLISVLLLLAPPHTASAKGELDTFRALLDEAHAKHKEVRQWWRSRETYASHKRNVLRAAFEGEDLKLARQAARGLDFPNLDTEGMARKRKLLSGSLEAISRAPWWAIDKSNGTLRSEDIPSHLKLAATATEKQRERIDYKRVRSCLTPRQLAGLLPLLASSPTPMFEQLLDAFIDVCEFDSEFKHQDAILVGLLYGLERLRAERANTKPPTLASVSPRTQVPSDGGLPEGILELFRSLNDRKRGFDIGDPKNKPLSVSAPKSWIQLALMRYQPAEKDLPFLRTFVDAFDAPTRAFASHIVNLGTWSMRHRARLSKEDAEQVLALTKNRDERSWCAATALALLGKPEVYRERLERHQKQDASRSARVNAFVELMSWRALPKESATRAAKRILNGPMDRRSRASVQFTPGMRELMRRMFGVNITPNHLRMLSDALWNTMDPESTTHIRKLAEWHVNADPESLSRERAKRLAKRLSSLPDLKQSRGDEVHWLRLLSLLEVRDRDATIALITTLLESQPGIKPSLLAALARLGVTGHEDVMLKAFRGEGSVYWKSRHRRSLTYVQNKTIDAELRRLAPDPEIKGVHYHDDEARSIDALTALVVRATGANELEFLWHNADATFEAEEGERHIQERKDSRAAWKHFRAGDTVSAAMVLADRSYAGLARLGAVNDPRITTYLEQSRAQRREGLWYWFATAGLARTQSDARNDVSQLLSSGNGSIMARLAPFEPRATSRPHWLRGIDGIYDLIITQLDSNAALNKSCYDLLRGMRRWIKFELLPPSTKAMRAYDEATHWVPSAVFGGLVPGVAK